MRVESSDLNNEKLKIEDECTTNGSVRKEGENLGDRKIYGLIIN